MHNKLPYSAMKCRKISKRVTERKTELKLGELNKDIQEYLALFSYVFHACNYYF